MRKRLFFYGSVIAWMATTSLVLVTRFLPPKTAAPQVSIGEFYQVGQITVNPSGTKGNRFLKVETVLETPDRRAIEELGRREIQVRDILITELSATPLSQLVEPEGKEEIRRRILDRVNSTLVTGSLSNVYFTQFVVQ